MRKLVSLTAVAALALGIGAGPAGADNVACGDTITVDTTLDENVGPCAGDGVTVTSGATLDLNHKRFRGTGGGKGIIIDGANVTVLNGSVQKFGAGIRVNSGSHGALIDGMTVKKMATYGIAVVSSDNVIIRNTKIVNAVNDGLDVIFSDNFLLENSKIMAVGRGTQGEGDSSCGAGNGIFMLGSDGSQFLNNKFNEISQSAILSWTSPNGIIDGNEITRTSSRPCIAFSTDFGAITIIVDSNNTTVSNNVVTDNEDAAIGLFGSSNIIIENNFLARNTSGVFFIAGGSGTSINDNCIFDSDTGQGLIISDAPIYTVDATNNFWGDADGPSGDGPLGTPLTGSGELIVQKVTDDVTVDPFRTACHLSEAEE